MPTARPAVCPPRSNSSCGASNVSIPRPLRTAPPPEKHGGPPGLRPDGPPDSTRKGTIVNTPQRTRMPRAISGVQGAHRARRQLTRRAVIARQLEQIAPGTAAVQTHAGEHGRAKWVVLTDAAGAPVGADAEQHRAAYGLLRRLLPDVDWTGPRTYDVATGAVMETEPSA